METIQLATTDSKEEAYELLFGKPEDPQHGLLGRLKEWKTEGLAGEAWTLEVAPTKVHDGTNGGWWQIVLHKKGDEDD